MAKIFLQTYGCSLNHADSETMAGVLEEAGHELVNDESEAELVLINSCTVKSNPEQRLFHQIRHRALPLLVAGCVPQADPQNTHFTDVSVIGPKALSKVASAVERTLQGEVVRYLESHDEDRNALPLRPEHAHIGILPINAGCLSNCSYCKTKHARGQLESFPARSIEKRFRELVNDGAKEVWLTSQDTATYGLDQGSDIVGLLEILLEKPGDYRIRLGMANPQFLFPRLERLITVLKHPNMFRFLHIPVQAGSDKVLRDMRRGYTTAQFREVVDRLLRAVPDLTVATDVIVGFPTETEEDFEATIELIEELRIPVVNISKFYPRPDTPAAAMPLLPTHVVKERSTRLKRVCEAIAAERNASFVGKELSVLVDEPGKKAGTLIGRADNYLQVILKEGAAAIGERLALTPSSSGVFDVRAQGL